MYKTFKKKVELINKIVDWKLISTIDFNDPSLYWKTVTFNLVSEVSVKKNSPINSKKDLYYSEFTINWARKTIEIDISKFNFFTYKWIDIDIDLYIEIIVNDSIFFDTKIKKTIDVNKFIIPKNVWYAERILNINDNYNNIKNFNALSLSNKIWLISLILLLLIIYLFLISIISLDFILFGILFFLILIYLFIKILKYFFLNFMTFFLKNPNYIFTKDKNYHIKDIVWWKSWVDLKNITLKVIACNVEKWQHTVWSWKNSHTEDISQPIAALELYNEKIDFIPKNTEISEYFKWSFSFERVKKELYLEQIISPTHWLKLHYEIQLISDDYIDKKIILDNSLIK